MIAIFPVTMDALGGNLVAYRSMSPELFFLFASYVLLTPWSHCQNYFLAYDKGPVVMRVVLITSVIGIVAWLTLMWLIGTLGIYIGFLLQMLLRSVGILTAAKTYWPIKVSWGGALGGVLLTSLGLVLSKGSL